MKTATELGITDAEHGALQIVRDGLAAGEYVHMAAADRSYGDKYFDMSRDCVEGSCGTIACIGGWVGLTMGYEMYDAESYVYNASESLDPLYFPKITECGRRGKSGRISPPPWPRGQSTRS